ncbi:hypothetical protein, partial [Lishizhenia sp.]|uniref:hypothetical protein n=1 Tax=Lishizhenia sp. TaxID=2497594 RepID=UPI00299D2906
IKAEGINMNNDFGSWADFDFSNDYILDSTFNSWDSTFDSFSSSFDSAGCSSYSSGCSSCSSCSGCSS